MVRAWRGTLSQPFATKLFHGIWRKHPYWMNKTIMVEENNIDDAFQVLHKMMDREGLVAIIRNTQYYMKPFRQRRQLSMAASNAIFKEDLNRKMQFLVRKNRMDAFPGQITTT